MDDLLARLTSLIVEAGKNDHGIGGIRAIDEDAIVAAAKSQSVVLSAEEHNMTSVFGSAVAQVLASYGMATRLIRIGMPDQYSILGPPTHLYRHYGLESEGVAGTVSESVARHVGKRRHPTRTTAPGSLKTRGA